jgi:hypothetical protein
MDHWQYWWSLSDEQREAIECALQHIVWRVYKGDVSRVREFIDRERALNTPIALAIATVVEDMIAAEDAA